MANSAAVASERMLTIRKIAVIFAKIAFTCVCFWLVFRRVRVTDLLHEAADLDKVWVMLAIIFAAFQIPLLGMRWAWIVDALESAIPRVPLRAMLAITMIGNFFAQFLPNVMGDAIRVWFLSQIRRGWRQGLAGVAIDRGVGVGVLLTIGLLTLANATTFTALSGYRTTVLATFAALLIGGIGGLIFSPLYAPLAARYRGLKWIAEFALSSRRVLIGSRASVYIVAVSFIVQFLSIADLWCLGRAFAMRLGVLDVATLFTLIVAIALVPITVNGWGLRELAVTAFLGSHGVPAQLALLFSICFGVTLLIAALPGGAVLLFYSPRRALKTPSIARGPAPFAD